MTKKIHIIWAGLVLLVLTMCWSQHLHWFSSFLFIAILVFPDICSRNLASDDQWCSIFKLRPPCLCYFCGVLLRAAVTGNVCKHCWGKKNLNQQRTLKFLAAEVKLALSFVLCQGSFSVIMLNLLSHFTPEKIFLLDTNVTSQHQCSMVLNPLGFCKKRFVKISVIPNIEEIMWKISTLTDIWVLSKHLTIMKDGTVYKKKKSSRTSEDKLPPPRL